MVLWDELDKWLQTPQAQKLGFHSKAQFATEAVREHLEQKRKGWHDEYSKILLKLNSIESKLNKTLEKQLSAKDRIDDGETLANEGSRWRTNQPRRRQNKTRHANEGK